MKRSDTVGYKIRLIHNQVHKTMEFKRKENEDDLTSMQRWMLGYLHEHEGRTHISAILRRRFLYRGQLRRICCQSWRERA